MGSEIVHQCCNYSFLADEGFQVFELPELCPPLGVFPGGMRRVQNGLYSRMVSENSHFLAIEIATEMTHGPHDSERFQLCHTVVSLCVSQGAAGICNWMAQSIFVSLG